MVLKHSVIASEPVRDQGGYARRIGLGGRQPDSEA
jgi:hypothetical protein